VKKSAVVGIGAILADATYAVTRHPPRRQAPAAVPLFNAGRSGPPAGPAAHSFKAFLAARATQRGRMRLQAAAVYRFLAVGAQPVLAFVDPGQSGIDVAQCDGRAGQMRDVRLALGLGGGVVVGFVSMPRQARLVVPMFTVAV
jgi:hypothetical protein